MRRLRPIRRRDRRVDPNDIPDAPGQESEEDDEQLAFEPFVQVPTTHAYQEENVESEPAKLRRRHIRVPRPHLGQIAAPRINIRLDLLLLTIILIGGGIFGVLLNQGRIRDDVEHWWPLLIVVGAALWMLLALARRHEATFLGAAAVTGIGLSFLMETQDIAELQETLIGVILVMVGLGIVIRGFLLRGQTM